MIKIISSIIGMILAGGAGFGIHQAYGQFNPTGGNTYVLQSSVSSSQPTLTLTSFREPGSNIAYTMTYINTDKIYGTLAPSSGNSEFISATGITQNGNGTATLTGVVRGLSRSPGTGGCVASSTLAHAYPGQTQFILSNSPCFYAEYAVRRNAQSITGRWTFTTATRPLLTADADATTTSQLITLGELQRTAIAGATNATFSSAGIVKIGTGAQAAAGNPTTGPYFALTTSIASSTCAEIDNILPVTSSFLLNPNCINTNHTYSWTHQIFSSFFASESTTTNATTTNLTVTGNTIGINPNATSTKFTASGTWQRPSGVTKVHVRMIGGGGAGGGSTGTGNTVGGGGGAGGYCDVIATVSGNVSVTVGAAGAGSSGAGGGSGGNSVFTAATTYTAAGGTGGGVSGTDASVAGGTGGSTTNCDFSGGFGSTGGKGTFGFGNGNAHFGGTGAHSVLGGGGAGAPASAAGGSAGTGFGAGGGGGYSDNAAGATTGGAGTVGMVIVEWAQTAPY